jgi:hypothetical protein
MLEQKHQFFGRRQNNKTSSLFKKMCKSSGFLLICIDNAEKTDEESVRIVSVCQ